MYVYVCILAFVFLGQNDFIKAGRYEFKNDNIHEVLILSKNQSFKYEFHGHFLHYSLDGHWVVHQDSLILNSVPQKDKIIVRESRRNSKNKYRFSVSDKLGNERIYSLFVFGENGEEFVVSDQWQKSKFKSTFKITSFFIQDTKGLKTPRYGIKGEFANSFEILYEPKRVFESEVWQIKDNMVIPVTINGAKANYALELIEE